MAIEDYEDKDVAVAVRRFIRGEVSRKRYGFLPSTDELAIEINACAESAKWEAIAKQRAALPPPKPDDAPRPRLTPEQLAARQRQVEELRQRYKIGKQEVKKAVIIDEEEELENIRTSMVGIKISQEALERLK